MKTRVITAFAALSLLLAQAAAAIKTGDNGRVTVLGDGLEFSAGSAGLTGAGGLAVDAALGGVAYSSPSAGAVLLESGFYSRMVATPAAFNYSGAGSSSYTLTWNGVSNPPGTTYEAFASTWAQAAPYLVYYSTSGQEVPAAGLVPNTSFYNFLLANYMDGDYSAFTATTAVTLAAAVSSGTFRFSDVGHNTLNLSFSAFENPGATEGAGWANPAPMPLTRYGQASVVYGSHVFVSGGYGAPPSSAVYRAEYNPVAGLGAWQLAGFMPEGLWGHQLVAVRGRLYVIGGRAQSAIRSAIWSADISPAGALGAWEAEVATGLPALYLHAAVAVGNRLYVSGGHTGPSLTSDIYKSLVGANGALSPWVAVDTLSSPRYAHTMTYLANSLYVVGGRDALAAKSEVWVYPLSDDGDQLNSRLAYPSLPVPRFGHTTLAAANALYVLGGNNGSGAQQTAFVSTAAAAANLSGPWAAYAPLDTPRQHSAGAAFGGAFYLFGGLGVPAPTNTAYTSVRGTSYKVEVSSDAAFAVVCKTSGWMSGYNWSFGELVPGATYYVRARSVNRLGAETAYSQIAATVTYSALPATAAWTEVYSDSATVNWSANGNSAETEYYIERSSNSDYSANTAAASGPALFWNTASLLSNTTYYARVKVLTSIGGPSRFVNLPAVFTSFDPAVDISSPAVNVVMDPRADPVWRSTNTFGCDVDFDDSGVTNSGLSYFEVKSSTQAYDPAGGWTREVTGINQGVYTQDWALPQGVWEQMKDGASNYISVQVVDRVGNTTTYLDAFSVLKDSTPPVLVSSYPVSTLLLTVSPGQVHSLRFTDPLSGLFRAQYSVSTNDVLPDGAVIGWTAISTPALTPGATFYEPVIPYDFGLLANAASNYFSFRIVDVAGSTSVYKNVFSIGKNVFGPIVAITAPAASPASLSTFSYAAGNATPTNGQTIEGSEVSLYDATVAKYYTGSVFTAGSRQWFDAQDAAGVYDITFANLPLVSGRQYQIVARSSDSAGDYSQSFATYTFTFDTQPPDTLVVSPVNSEPYSGASCSGAASDAYSGISAVDIALKRAADGQWWTGAAWNAAITTIAATGGTTWNYNFPPYLRDSLVHGASYYVTSRALDQATPPNAGRFSLTGSTFTYLDATPPPKTVALAAAGGVQRGSVLLSWPAAGDNAAAGYLFTGTYRVAYTTYTPAQVSTASEPGITISTANLTAGAAQARLFTGLDAGTSYYFTLWTADDALNWSPASDAVLGVANALNAGGLTGNVADASMQPITGVLVEALGVTGAVEGSDHTDALGNYSITGLSSEVLSVRASFTVQDIESSVSKDGISNGVSGVNFTLSNSYDLAVILGFIPSGYLPQRHAAPAGARYTTRAVRPESSQPFAEIYRRGRRLGVAFVDANGAFEVPNLLPATYGLRVYNGTDFSEMATVKLHPGERLMFTAVFALLNKDEVFAYPNPASTKVNFHFVPINWAAGWTVQVEVFDIAGRLVKTLKDSELEPSLSGRRVVWNLSGESIASGVYLYILRVKDAAGVAAKPVIRKFAIIR